MHARLLKHVASSRLVPNCLLRTTQRPTSILDEYANVYRPEVESELEHLAVQTTKNRSLQIDYELEQQRRRQRTVRYHILKHKYVAHPNDVEVDLYVKNHMQFLHRNYPKRWTVPVLAESFNRSVDDVRLILRQRTTRRMRVRPRVPSSLFGVQDEETAERQMREHMMKRDLSSARKAELDDGEPVDYQVLAEESKLVARRRPSDGYRERENDGFFSNVLSSADKDQQDERDTSTKRIARAPPSTLLDRLNKLRLTTTTTTVNSASDYEHSGTVDEQRLNIIQKMQQSNDAIVDSNERKQKYRDRQPSKKSRDL